MNSILYIIPTLNSGGAELQTISQVNRIHELGERSVHLCILHDSYPLLEKVSLPEQYIHRLDLKTQSFNHHYVLKPEKLRACRQIARIIDEHKIDTLIAVLNPAHFVARLTRWLYPSIRQAKLITYYRNVYFQLAPLDSWKRRAFNLLMSGLARVDDGTIFISKAVEADISENRFVANKNVVIFNSVKEQVVSENKGQQILEDLGLGKGKFNILFPGRLHMQKGHLFFLKVFSDWMQSLSTKRDEVVLLIAGAGSLKEKILIECDRLGITGQVFLIGNVDNAVLMSLMKCVNLVVIPSKYEGFGNVAIEAIMAGATVLTSDAGGLDEIVIDAKNGYKFRRMDEEHCLTKLGLIYNNYPERKINPSLLWQDFKSRFSLDAQLRQILSFVDGI